MKLKSISGLEKCFLTESADEKKEYSQGSCLQNELYHFEVCFQAENNAETGYANVTVESELAERVRLWRIEPVPVQFPARPGSDDLFLSKKPGLYPDLLQPLEENGRVAISTNLRSLMVEVDVKQGTKPGVYPITLCFEPAYPHNKETRETCRVTFSLEVINAVLPPQELKFTQWFHCDGLARYYQTEAFDDEHFAVIERFARTAVKYGVNTLLTPVFTPPLDTAVGGERDTMQLVGVTKQNGVYAFDFSLLDRWVAMCDRVGIRYFEISHFFTQWGAKAAPKIMATVDGVYQKLFGWETDATSDEYAGFLQAFIPAFLAHMKALGGADQRCFFHISDEPNQQQLEGYLKAKAIVAPLLKGYPVMDALSNYEFYSSGAVEKPVVSTLHIEEFLGNDVPDLWAYYCVTEDKENLSNRFIAMPSFRNRILGTQLYKFGITGFLHWGYNFYFNQYSFAFVNPFLNTDGEYFSPGGDAFSVYPGQNGVPMESLRLLVFFDGLQDMRAYQLCEKLCGRERVLRLMEEEIAPVTFRDYPQNGEYLLKTREKINRAIAEQLQS